MTPRFWHRLGYFLNFLMVMVLGAIIAGALSIQFFLHEEPCPLCLLQRLGMFMVMLAALMNLHFGIQPLHYGMGLLGSIYGATVAGRQILLHIVPGTGAYGSPVLGLHLYTWSFLSFVCLIIGIAVMLIIYQLSGQKAEPVPDKPFPALKKIAFGFAALLLLINVVATFIECGIGVCPDNP